MPKRIGAYETEWMTITQRIVENGSFILPCQDVKRAGWYRLRFYGFRNALAAHDTSNPWLSALLETQATIDVEGNLVLTRSPLSTLLRGLLENSVVHQGPTESVHEAADPVNPQAEHDKALLEYLNRRD
jgi:hypothetical protein